MLGKLIAIALKKSLSKHVQIALKPVRKAGCSRQMEGTFRTGFLQIECTTLLFVDGTAYVPNWFLANYHLSVCWIVLLYPERFHLVETHRLPHDPCAAAEEKKTMARASGTEVESPRRLEI